MPLPNRLAASPPMCSFCLQAALGPEYRRPQVLYRNTRDRPFNSSSGVSSSRAAAQFKASRLQARVCSSSFPLQFLKCLPCHLLVFCFGLIHSSSSSLRSPWCHNCRYSDPCAAVMAVQVSVYSLAIHLFLPHRRRVCFIL
ncbi:hypothetical protein DFH09DRAFT_1275700, partial [Mycena vulgaris]